MFRLDWIEKNIQIKKDFKVIHSTAVIEKGAKIGDNVKIGAYSFIGMDVVIGDNCTISSHVVITGNTKCGVGNKFFPFSCIGEVAQDKKHNGETTHLVIGDNNIFREYATVHRGTVQDEGITRIGSNNLFMAYSHVAHDAVIGNNVVFSNSATVGGHVHVGDWAILSGSTSIHQFCKIGTHAFIGGHSGVAQDVLPFVTVMGTPAKPVAINIEGMKRRGYTPEEIMTARRAYKTIYRKGLMLTQAKEVLVSDFEGSDVVQVMLKFLAGSTRGISR